MKLKNISPVERHVEKIVLVVAVAAAAYLGYSSIEHPITVIDTKGHGAEVHPGDVEKIVNEAVDHLRLARDKASHVEYPPLQPYNPDIPTEDKGLPKGLLADVAKFGPNEASAGAGTEENRAYPIATPLVPAPTNPALDQFRGVVILNAPPPGVKNATWTPNTRDMSWVRITAAYNMVALADSIAGADVPANESPIPLDAQRVSVVRVETERRVKNPDGTFSAWQSVDPIPGQIGPAPDQPFWDIDLNKLPDDPKVRLEYLNKVDQNVNDIVHPPFLPVQNAPAAEAAPAPLPPPPPVAAGARPPAGILGRPAPVAPAAPAPAPAPLPPAPLYTPPAAPVQNVNIAAMLKDPALQLVAYDPNVEPDCDVQYRLRLEIYNPLYKFPANLKLVQPAVRNQPYLASDWVQVPAAGTIHTQANQFFWLTAGVGGGVDAKIYLWAGGRWVETEDTLTPGCPVGQPRTPAGFPKGLNFSTPYVVVDILENTPAYDTSVVLLNTANGQVVTRTLNTDANDPRRMDFERQAHPALAPVPAAPGAAAALP